MAWFTKKQRYVSAYHAATRTAEPFPPRVLVQICRHHRIGRRAALHFLSHNCTGFQYLGRLQVRQWYRDMQKSTTTKVITHNILPGTTEEEQCRNTNGGYIQRHYLFTNELATNRQVASGIFRLRNDSLYG